MKFIKNNLLLVGVILSYLIIFSSSSLKLFFLAFLIFFIFSLLYIKDFKKALFLTAVFALPYSKGKHFFSIDDYRLIGITPFIACVLILSLFSLKKLFLPKLYIKLYIFDLFLFLFFLWGVLSFIFANMQPQILHYLFRLGIFVIFYFLARIYLLDEKIRKISILLLVSFIVFESTLSIIQFMAGRPLGMLAEEGIEYHPYGRLSDEDNALLRVSGTFGEPTYLARFLTILLPLLFLKKKEYFLNNLNIKLLILFTALLAIFLSFTRFSWFVALIIIFVMLKKLKIRLSQIKKPFIILLLIILFGLGIKLYPFFEYKMLVGSQTFQEFGSFDFRIKLIKESLALISQYPLFGVGFFRFDQFASQINITGIYDVFESARVLNVFLRIASEMGVPALIFFIGFIISSYCLYFDKRRKIKSKTILQIKNTVAFGGLIYLLESMMGGIFITPHFLLFLLYMAVMVV